MKIENTQECYNSLPTSLLAEMNIICGATGRKLTEEQAVFASDFTKPTISFSDAGTGKTYAATVGIVLLQSYYKMRGSKICVVSYTREAALEISQRYTLMSKYQQVEGKPAFGTFHKICRDIIKGGYRNLQIVSGNNWDEEVPLMRRYCEDAGLTEIKDSWLKQLLQCMNYTTSAFIFDPDNLKEIEKFKKLGIDPGTYNTLVKKHFQHQLMTEVVPQGDIPIHTMYQLCNTKKISDKYSKMFDVVVMDEFQDMSPLYMKIIASLGRVCIAIGDMKQQIYAFNGASDDIVRDFMREFPDAKVCALTHSFRCRDNIVGKAMEVELPNKPPVLEWQGSGEGGEVTIRNTRDAGISDIARHLAKYEKDTSNSEKRDIMFLARNNLSILSIIETLYQHGVKFRSNKFKTVMEIPIFREMCLILDAIEEPRDEDKVWKCITLFDEFKWDRRYKHPFLLLAKDSNQPFYMLNYRFKKDYMRQIMKLFANLSDKMFDDNVTAGQLFNTLFKIYDEFIIKGEYWRLEMDKSFYINLAAPIANTKSWERFKAEEYDKAAKNQENLAYYNGIRCYTIHSAKGLEADEVYIIDCDKDIIPSDKNLEKNVKANCLYEAARMIRNERNLLYVAITRAKSAANICYSSELSSLIRSPDENEYTYLNDVYENYGGEYENLSYFMSLFRLDRESV